MTPSFLPPSHALGEGSLFSIAPSGPMRSNNTWLNGQWETTASDGSEWKATLAPLSNDRFQLSFQRKATSPQVPELSGTATGWIARVGDASLLILELAQSQYVVLGFQTLNPLLVRTRELKLPPDAKTDSPYKLRAQIRAAFKNGTLFSGEQAIWKKTGEIFWNPRAEPSTGTFTPVRNVLSKPASVHKPAPVQ